MSNWRNTQPVEPMTSKPTESTRITTNGQQVTAEIAKAKKPGPNPPHPMTEQTPAKE
jgi:hypothetical protein